MVSGVLIGVCSTLIVEFVAIIVAYKIHLKKEKINGKKEK